MTRISFVWLFSQVNAEAKRWHRTAWRRRRCMLCHFLCTHCLRVLPGIITFLSPFAIPGASAYVRDGPDETSPMDLDPMTASLAQVPSVSIIEKNARIMRWLAACNKSYAPSAQPFSGATPRSPLMPVSVPYRESNQTAKPVSPRSHPRQGHRSYGSPMKVNSHVAHVPSQVYTVRHPQPYVSTPPPIPPRIGIPKESDVWIPAKSAGEVRRLCWSKRSADMCYKNPYFDDHWT